MKTKELRNLSNEELMQKHRALLDDLFAMNQQRYSGRVEKPNRFGLIKKDIARIQTILKEREKSKDGKA